MSSICPVCRTEFTKAKCESCGFEMPRFAFLSEDDANGWYRKSLENHKKKTCCKNCGKEMQEDWKFCPYCGSAVIRENSPAFSSLQLVRTFVGHKGIVQSVAFSPDGKYMASTNQYYDAVLYRIVTTLQLWEAKGGWLIRTIENVGTVAFSPDSKCIVPGEGTLELREVESWEVARTIQGVQGNLPTLNPDGNYIVSWADDMIMRLWEAESGQLVRTFIGQKDDNNSFIFSPNGKYIVSMSNDGTLKQWETESGRLRILRIFEKKYERYSFAFSPDGKYLVSGSGQYSSEEGELKLWEVESGRLVHAFDEKARVFSVAFSPDGNYLVSGSGQYGFCLKLWETESGRLIHTTVGNNNSVDSVAFNPDGKYLISGLHDGTLILWELV